MNIIFDNFDKKLKCEVIYNDYKEFVYLNLTVEEAKEIFDKLKSTNYKDFYFRAFSKEFDYVYNYGEEIYDLESIEPNEKLYLNNKIKSLPKAEVKGIKKDNFPVYFRMGYIQGDDD
jgi:predicted S18 family serine protease